MASINEYLEEQRDLIGDKIAYALFVAGEAIATFYEIWTKIGQSATGQAIISVMSMIGSLITQFAVWARTNTDLIASFLQFAILLKVTAWTIALVQKFVLLGTAIYGIVASMRALAAVTGATTVVVGGYALATTTAAAATAQAAIATTQLNASLGILGLTAAGVTSGPVSKIKVFADWNTI